MNHHSFDEVLTATLGAGAPDAAVRTRMLDAIRADPESQRLNRPLRIAVSIIATALILLVGVATAAVLIENQAEDAAPDVVAAAVNLLEPPRPGTVRHVSYSASIAYPSINEPSTVHGESWERVNEDGSRTQAVIVFDGKGEVLARAVDIDGEIWSDLDGQVYSPDWPVAVPPQVLAGMTALRMGPPEDFFADLRSQEDVNYTTEQQDDTGNYVVSVDITEDFGGGEDSEAEKAEFEAEIGVEVERFGFEVELPESLDRFVRREFYVITPAGERISFNRIDFSAWEDVDASEVDPASFSTEIPMTSAPEE